MTDDDRTGPDILDSGFKLSPLIKQVLAESQATEVDELATEVFELIKPHDRPMALFQALRTMVRAQPFRPAFIPAAPSQRTEQVTQSVNPLRDGRQWLASDGQLFDSREEVAAAREAEAVGDAVEQEAAHAVADGVMSEDDARSAAQAALASREPETRRPAPAPTERRLTSLPSRRPQRPVAPPPRPQSSPKVAAIREAWRKALNDRISMGSGNSKFLKDCTVADLEFAAEQRERHAKRVEARAADLRTLAALLRTHDVKTVAQVPAEVLASMSETLTGAAAA